MYQILMRTLIVIKTNFELRKRTVERSIGSPILYHNQNSKHNCRKDDLNWILGLEQFLVEGVGDKTRTENIHTQEKDQQTIRFVKDDFRIKGC